MTPRDPHEPEPLTPADLRLTVMPGGPVPIYRQITQGVRLAIATGRATPGAGLPSVRGLAEALIVNPNTVAKAYAELTRDGVVTAQPGRGLFVAPPSKRLTAAEQKRRLDLELGSLAHTALELGVPPDRLVAALEQKLKSLGLTAAQEKRS